MGIILAPKLIPLYVAGAGAGVATGMHTDLEGIGWFSKDGEYANGWDSESGYRNFNHQNGEVFSHFPNLLGEVAGGIGNGALAGTLVALPLAAAFRFPGGGTQAARLGVATMLGVSAERIVNGTRDDSGNRGASKPGGSGAEAYDRNIRLGLVPSDD